MRRFKKGVLTYYFLKSNEISFDAQETHVQDANKLSHSPRSDKAANNDVAPVHILDSHVSSPMKGRVIELPHEKFISILKEIKEKRAETADKEVALEQKSEAFQR